jgi:hypothetical protein
MAKKTFLQTRNSLNQQVVQVVIVVRVAIAAVTVVATGVAAVEAKEEKAPAGTAKIMLAHGGITLPAAVETVAEEDNCNLISKQIKDVTAEKDRI